MGANILIRADASAEIGTGHLMRCLALAQGWQANGGQVIFITACESASLLQRLSDEGFQIVTLERAYPDPADWEATSQVLAAHPNAWVVLDGYHFDEAYQQRVKEAGHRLLVIDDMAHLEHYYADIVVNQNLHADQLNYSCESYTRLLLGTRYVLLRREFLKWRGWDQEVPDIARKMLVTLGGADPDNVTLKVIQALQLVNIEGLEAVVVVGGSNPHYEDLRSAIRQSIVSIRLECNVADMPALMAWADLAVSGAGTSIWETAYMRLPVLAITMAENQSLIANSLGEHNIAQGLGWHSQISTGNIARAVAVLSKDYGQRCSMSEKAQALVDGEGMARVFGKMPFVPGRKAWQDL